MATPGILVKTTSSTVPTPCKYESTATDFMGSSGHSLILVRTLCSSECPVAKTGQLEDIVGIDREEIKRMERRLVSRCADATQL